MIRTARATALTRTLLLLAALFACGKKDNSTVSDTRLGTTTATATMDTTPIRVSDIQLGKAVGADRRITEPTTTFGIRDTIHVSVITEGAAKNAAIDVQLFYSRPREGGNPVSVQTIRSFTGTSATDVQLSQARPWSPGPFKVEVSLNGASAGTREFEVK
ncbi:MAG TPA: hypothetical protein VK544_11070 [Gemmatimonadaceae bacterium]|nr:hypothetical protein [Gemmatimonadaceae bacterium]